MRRLAAVITLTFGLVACICRAEEKIVTSGLDDKGVIRVAVHKSVVLQTSRSFRRINIGASDMADINAMSPTKVLVTGKQAGSTSFTIWDENDQFQMIDVEVTGPAAPAEKPQPGMTSFFISPSKIPGFIRCSSDRTTLEVNVNQIVAIVTAPPASLFDAPPTTAPAAKITRIVLAGGGEAMPHSLQVSDRMSADDVIAIVKAARESNGAVTSAGSRAPAAR